MKKKILALLLALLMITSAMPLSDIAELVPDISVPASAYSSVEEMGKNQPKEASIVLDNGQTAYFNVTLGSSGQVFIEPTGKGNVELFYGGSNTVTITPSMINKIRNACYEVHGSTAPFITLVSLISKGKRSSLKGSVANVDLSQAKSTDENSVVVGLGDGIFKDFTNLQTVTLSDKIWYIGKEAFSNCKLFIGEDNGGKGIDLSNVSKIGEGAFKGCSILEKVKLGNSITEIEKDTFNKCTKLVEINIPEQVRSIGDNAFNADVALQKVTFYNRNSIKMGKSVFSGCTSLATINSVKEVKGELKTFNNTLPDLLYRVGESCFSKCTSLNTIKIGTSLTYIPTSMFNSCTGLKSVSFVNSVNSYLEWVGNSAFQGCTELT